MFESLNGAGLTPTSVADVASAWASVIAFIALLVGVATLLSGARTSRLQQMHDLFKEYLKLEFEYNAAVGERNANRAKLRGNLGGFKMYSLEEMTLWLRRERSWSIVYFWSPFHRRHIRSWQATVNWHLDQCSDRDLVDFEIAIECYGPDFIKKVRERAALRPPRPVRSGVDGDGAPPAPVSGC